MKLVNIIFHLLIVFSIISCETAPPVKPIAWTRTLPETMNIEAGSSIYLYVTGETEPLSGNDELVAKRLEDHASDILLRRGYTVSKENYSLKCIINYKTNLGSRLSFNSQTSSYTSSRFSMYSNYFIGDSIFNNTVTSTTTDVYESAAFLHTISVDLYEENGNLVWSGNSAWESSDLNILSNSYMVFRKLFSIFPKSNNILAYIPMIRENRVLDYYRHYCKNIWFTSFALPYQIRFDPLQNVRQNPNDQNSPIITILPKTISDGQNLAAYIDLIIMSELALPGGTVDDWKKNPLSDHLWKEAILGGRYIIGNNENIKNILINLKKISGGNGYAVNNSRIVSDEEYDQYLENLLQWQIILKEHFIDFYNFYE